MKLLFFLKRMAVFSLLPVILFSSCKQEVKPVTPEEAKEFSKKLELSVSKKEAKFFDEAIDKNELIKRAHISSGKNATSFKKGLSSAMTMGTTMKRELSDKAVYTLVKQYVKDNVTHVLFRLYDNGSLNASIPYHDNSNFHCHIGGKEHG